MPAYEDLLDSFEEQNKLLKTRLTQSLSREKTIRQIANGLAHALALAGDKQPLTSLEAYRLWERMNRKVWNV